MDRFLSAVDSGEFTHRQLRNAGFAFTDVLFWETAPTRAIQLRFNNRAEQIAAQPAEQQQTAFQRLETESRNLPFASRMLVPAILRVATDCLSSRARLRCASAALGCERYRLAHGEWPSALEELVPRFLPRLPIDPFDAKPHSVPPRERSGRDSTPSARIAVTTAAGPRPFHVRARAKTLSFGSGARHTVVNRRRPTDPLDAPRVGQGRREHEWAGGLFRGPFSAIKIAPAGPYSLFHSRLASPQPLFKCTWSSTRATQLVGMKWCWPSGLSFFVSLIVEP